MRTKLIGCSVAMLLSCYVPASVQAGATISFGPGPDGSTRINTPWGVYVAVATPGGVWVGTEEELMDAKAREVFRRDGSKLVHLQGDGPRGSYVSKGIEAAVGASRLYDIQAYTLIGLKPDARLHRPVHPKGTDYFGFVWVASNRQPVTARILIDGKAITPFECGQDGQFRNCEFNVTREEMTRPAQVFFMLPGNRPAVVQYASLARGACDAIQAKYAHDADLPASEDDLHDLASLHAIDQTLPAQVMPQAKSC